MIRKLFAASIFFVLVYSDGKGKCNHCSNAPNNSISPSTYPNQPAPGNGINANDTYPGNTIVEDHYRWLENVDSKLAKDFIAAEMAITGPYLNQSPSRAEMEARYKELINIPQFYTGLTQAGNKFFLFQYMNDDGNGIFFVQDSVTGPAKVFYSAPPGLYIYDYSISHDGQLFAFALRKSDSNEETVTMQFKHIEKGTIYHETLKNVGSSSGQVFTHDGKGFFYGGFLDAHGKPGGPLDAGVKNFKTFYHVLGQEQSTDIVVVEFPHQPTILPTSELSDDGKYLIITASNNEVPEMQQIYFADLEKIHYNITTILDAKPIFPKLEATYLYITNNENIFIFKTNKGSEKNKLITVDIASPNCPASLKDLVPADEKRELQRATAANAKYLILVYEEDFKCVPQLHDITTGKMIKKFNIDTGLIQYVASDKRYKDAFIILAGFQFPGGAIYHCDLSQKTPEFQFLKEQEVKNYDSHKFTSEQVLYPSKDGTLIPMIIVHKKDLQKNGNNPALILSLDDFELAFNHPLHIMFLSNFDGLYAVVKSRGVGFDDKWVDAAKLKKKQNCFDDFQAGAKYLIDQKYTSNKLLVIYGAGDGGLRVAACINQSPELFGAAIAWEGLMDMLRYNKFPGGKNLVSEYGSPTDAKYFPYLNKYSPVQNVKYDPKIQHPATLLITLEHDSTTPAIHSLKFIAALQSSAKNHTSQTNPLLIKLIPDKDTQNGKFSLADAVDQLSFLIRTIGIKFHP